MTALDRVSQYDWLRNSLTLKEYLWAVQPPEIKDQVSKYLFLWFQHRFLGGPRPLPTLILFGPTGTGKTDVARAIARFFILNFAAESAELVNWPAYVEDQLNGRKLVFNRQAQILLMDELDGRRPVGESLSPWLLEKAGAWVKPHTAIYQRPLLVTCRRHPGKTDMIKFLSTSHQGGQSEQTREAARAFVKTLSQHCFGVLEFKGLDSGGRGLAEYYASLREQAALQSLDEFKFLEPHGKETLF